MTFHAEVNLIVGLNVKWSILRKSLKKFKTWTGFEPVTGAML